MKTPLNIWCVSCGHRFHGGSVTPPPDETQNASILFGANTEQLLCNLCAMIEGRKEEETGTNDIPELLETYQKSSFAPSY